MALANDNWMGRMPYPLTPGGELLHEMELKSLARGRMCVNKIIAKPERRGPVRTRQGGLRGNSIAFPQAKLELLDDGGELPAPPEAIADFLSKSVIVALAGVDKERLDVMAHSIKFRCFLFLSCPAPSVFVLERAENED